jgi:hypothetical protein
MSSMPSPSTSLLNTILDIPYIRRTRRNHGLEHATIHMLSALPRPVLLSGRSDASGFVLVGEADTDQIERAIANALARMRAGQHGLAIHPNCGTAFLTAGFMVTGAAWLGSVGVRRGARDYVDRLPFVLVLSVLALIAAQPVGLKLQERVTTLGDPGDLEVISVRRSVTKLPGGHNLTTHRVTTRST